MPKLSMEEIGELAKTAWGASEKGDPASSDVVTAVAVAWAESGGETTAHNDKYPDDSYGLWQINMLGKMGEARRKQLGLSSNQELFDPATNARAAHQVWTDAGGKWTPWTTYTSGAYMTHVPAARRAVGNDLGSPPTYDNFVDEIADAVVSIAQTIWKGAEWVSNPHNWGRVIVASLGGALVIGALVVLAKPNTGVVDAVTAAPKAATKAVR